MQKWAWAGLGIALLLAVFISPFASSWPDGLERVAEDLHFNDSTYEDPLVAAPVPDYAVPGVENVGVATGMAGFLGTVLVFGISLLLGKILKNRKGQKRY